METDKLKAIIQQQAQKHEWSGYLDRILSLVCKYAKQPIDEFRLRHRISTASFEEYRPLMWEIIQLLPLAKKDEIQEVVDAFTDYHNLIHARWDKIDSEFPPERQELFEALSDLFHLDMKKKWKTFSEISQVDRLCWIKISNPALQWLSPDEFFLGKFNKSLEDFEISVIPLSDPEDDAMFYGSYEGRFSDKEHELYQGMITAMKKYEYGKAFRKIVPVYLRHPKFFRAKFNYISLKLNYILREKYEWKIAISRLSQSQLKDDIHFLECEFWKEVENLKKQQPDYPMREKNKAMEKKVAKDIKRLITILKRFVK